MIKDFEKVCVIRQRADVVEKNCEEVLRAITHEPMTAKQIAEHGNIMRADYDYDCHKWIDIPNYQRVANEAKILIALGLVKRTAREVEIEIEVPEHDISVMIADKQIGNKILDFHYEYDTIPASKQIVKKTINLYSLAN